MWLTGFDSLMPEGRKTPWKYLPHLGTHLSVTFGEPIPPHTIRAALQRESIPDSHPAEKVQSWVSKTGTVPTLSAQVRDAQAEEESRRIRSMVTDVIQREVEALGTRVSQMMLDKP
ncbi:hypothetical protein EWM64_g4934 [Hericium alpestre]|uniref:Tafazzin family protein n=1 Tax=Hericium alpestre TaxID=135208 RepID=A0A4Y9ZY08_9AGAM|nr:hypothetical protein EWM64_g4934 [Hericium alpestre]